MTVSRQDGARPAAAPASDPRANQRERTRTAIMDGARKLLREGKIPSIADAAEEARVSRATAYRYFPSQGALINEAAFTALTRTWDPEKLLADAGTFADRVERAISEIALLGRENEALLRGALLLSLQQWAALQAGEQLAEEPISRGGRLPAIRAVVDPYEDTLGPAALRRLTIALSLIAGTESLVVLRDIWNLDDGEADQVVRWIARTLAQATVNSASPGQAESKSPESRSRAW